MNNSKGIALMMVLSSIAILTAIIMSFSYEAQINQIRSYNLVDRTQAKLAAESGLKIAMGQLRIYKEIYNKVQQNETLKQNVDSSLINQIWQLPIIYPIPFSDDLSVGQKNMIEDFKKDSILEGEFQVSIQNLGNKINLNLLRLSYLNQKKEDNQDEDEEDEDKLSFKGQFVQLLKKSMESKMNTDPLFEDTFSKITPEFLIALIEVYISDDSELCESEYCRQAESAYQKEEIIPKGAPLSNLDELYLLPVWNKELIDLIKNEVNVHPILMIDLDSMTSKMLNLIFPDLTIEQIDEYFKWKNDGEQPQIIEQPEDIKPFFVDLNQIMSNEEFTRRFDDLKKIGIQFGPDSNLFRVLSQGKYLEATYELEAIISMPLLPTPSKKIESPAPSNPFNPNTAPPPAKPKKEEEEKTYPVQLLEPRIVDLFVR